MLAQEARLTGEPTVARRPGTIYVLLPVHDRRPITESFVKGLIAQQDPSVHLVVLDDGSTDRTGEAVTALLPSATILRGDGTWWWAGSLQRAFHWLRQQELTTDDLVLIANDDTVLGPGFLAAGRTALRPRQLLLARLFDQESGAFVELGVHADWKRLRFRGVKDSAEVNCFSTRGLFLHASDFLELGGFHPRLLPHYLSDYEFTMRAHRRGFDLISDPAVHLSYNPLATGIRHADKSSLSRYLSQTLSTRSAMNPIFWTTFLLLACPRRYLARNVYRVWRGFARGLLQSLAARS